MIVVLRPGISAERKQELIAALEGRGLRVDVSEGARQTVLGLVGDSSELDEAALASLPGVESVRRVSEPFLLCSRREHPESAVVQVGPVRFGGGHFALIAGPCAVESEEQILAVARAVKAAGADMLRGGAFKPRTSPYDFSGLGEEGLRLLGLARAETGLPVVSEIMSVGQLPLFEDVDLLQVGARSMQNFELLRELGRIDKPILLKRAFSATLRELLMSAEHIMAGGNERVILCERGIRTFSDYTRNTLDLSAVPELHELTQLPVIVDPSHATGRSSLVGPMALAAAACGADGVMIEVHGDPPRALSDAAQALDCAQFAALADRLRAVRKAARA